MNNGQGHTHHHTHHEHIHKMIETAEKFSKDRDPNIYYNKNAISSKFSK